MKKFNAFFKLSLTNACYSFSATMCLNLLSGLAQRKAGFTVSSLLCLMLICLSCGILQVTFFSDLLLQKSSYALRLLLFAPSLFAAVALLSIIFGFLPVRHLGAWLRFLGVFLAILAAMSALFALTARARGKKYDALLQKYHEEHRN